MKNHILVLLAIIYSAPFLIAQNNNIDNNILKYWNYRARLRNNFVAVGSEAGESLPFASRNKYGQTKLAQGEGPIMLGHYIGVLATEYKLLHLNKQDTEPTLQELYYALHAFNRLDLVAETSNGYNKEPKLDGFFVREDFPSDFVSTHPSLNKKTIKGKKFTKGSGKTFTVNCTTDKGETACDNMISASCKVKASAKGYAKKYTHIPMSLDQILGVLIGVSLVNKMLDADVTYLDKVFQDNESSLKKEAQNIAERIITNAKNQHLAPKEPDGDYIGDCDFRGKSKPHYFKNNATLYFFPRLTPSIGTAIYGKKYHYFPFVDLISGGASIQFDNMTGSFFHRRMYIEIMTMSGKDNNIFVATATKVKRKSEKYNWEAFYHTLGLLLHDWEKDSAIEKQTLEMLNAAPFDGPYFHGLTDFAKGGWATEDRFTSSLGAQYNGSRFPENTGNYNGLDYMLLHNMYLLAYQEAPKSYGKLITQDKANYKHTTATFGTEKCMKSQKQSCKERRSYYQFLHDFIYENCDDSKEKCNKRLDLMFNRKFGVDYKEVNLTCKKEVYKKNCEKKLNPKKSD